MRPRTFVVLLLTMALAGACGGGGGGGGRDAGRDDAGVPALALTAIASDLVAPLFVTAAPGDDSRLFIVEQPGRIRVRLDGRVLPRPWLDLADVVSCCGERGLLGLAFHPDDRAGARRFYVNYTNLDGDTVVAELRQRADDPDAADRSSLRVLLTIEQPRANHNGGMLAFGPDGTLFIAVGDGGGAGDEAGNAQDPQSRLGKLLRIDVDDVATPPPGNLPGADPLVWDLGLRNPFRFSFDRETGDLYIGDVGQGAFEEIDVERRGDGGRNYGWNVTEGPACFAPPEGCDRSGLTPPVATYGRDLGCSVIGGYVYRGAAIPALRGRYLYGDFCSNRVFSFVFADGGATRARELSTDLESERLLAGLTSFGEDNAGEIYLTSRDGRVFRIEPE